MARTAESEVVYLDTHVVLWLHDKLLHFLSPRATEFIETSQLLVSPLVELELQYLYEIGRIRLKPEKVIETLVSTIGVMTAESNYGTVIHHAKSLHWTRDPFDRLLVGETMAAGAKLITRDEMIRKHFADAIW